jgi:hypothetical protein
MPPRTIPRKNKRISVTHTHTHDTEICNVINQSCGSGNDLMCSNDPSMCPEGTRCFKRVTVCVPGGVETIPGAPKDSCVARAQCVAKNQVCESGRCQFVLASHTSDSYVSPYFIVAVVVLMLFETVKTLAIVLRFVFLHRACSSGRKLERMIRSW